jgi:hypothetical protein
MAPYEPASLSIFSPHSGRFNIQTSGEFLPYGFIANRLAAFQPG